MRKKIQISIAILGITVLGVLINLFLVGEPVDGKQLAYHVAEDNAILELQVFATESAIALKSWKIEQNGNDLFISARKVPVSFVFPSGEYRSSVHTDGIEHIYLGGQMIWSNKSDSK